MKNHIFRSYAALAGIALAWGLASCQEDDIDNSYSRNNSIVQLTGSQEYVVLSEANPEAEALSIDWTPAADYGNDFLCTYKLETELIGSEANAIKEYEDDGNFHRSYTNRELQEMLVGKFGQGTSMVGELRFTLTTTFQGPRTVVPDISTLRVRVKTYGPKQYLADQLFMGGNATGDGDVELTADANNGKIYRYNGKLQAGKINFPVLYADESNAVSPAEGEDRDITAEEMPFVIVDRAEAHYWNIPEEGNYRITLNLDKKTVKIVDAGATLELDKLYMAGAAVGDDMIEIEQTLEDENLYAWKGELKSGAFWLPVGFEENTAVSLAPKAGKTEIADGEPMEFTQVSTESGTKTSYWTIPADGIYRVVVDTQNRTMTFRSAATDLKNAEVSYNNTVAGINPYKQEVTELWMWGTYNNFARDADQSKAGFQAKYRLTQSLANPKVFAYKGTALPRETGNDANNKNAAVAATVKFMVSNIENNVYCYGAAGTDAKRNDHSTYTPATLGSPMPILGGQGDNRYAYFVIPEGCNYVVLDIENGTVVFDVK
ncbi:MAG: SusE domain-containing protein [Clostridium sp.]|nr:SusE domain-containing protein [Clostridium sp.]